MERRRQELMNRQRRMFAAARVDRANPRFVRPQGEPMAQELRQEREALINQQVQRMEQELQNPELQPTMEAWRQRQEDLLAGTIAEILDQETEFDRRLNLIRQLATNMKLPNPDKVIQFIQDAIGQPLTDRQKETITATFDDLPDDAMYGFNRDRIAGLAPQYLDPNNSQIRSAFLRNVPNPYLESALLAPPLAVQMRDIQANQIENIIDKFEEALGTDENSNYFKLRESGLKAKWKAIINPLKDITSQILENRQSEQGDIGPGNLFPSNRFFSKVTQGVEDSIRIGMVPLFENDAHERGYYSTFLKSAANIDCSEGVHVWMRLSIAVVNVQVIREIFTALKNYNDWFILDTDEEEMIGEYRQPRQIANQGNTDMWAGRTAVIFIKMQTFRANASEWKFQFKARAGLFDRLYKSFGVKMDFSGFMPTDTEEQLEAKVTQKLNDSILSQTRTITQSDFFLSFHSLPLRQAFVGVRYNSYYVASPLSVGRLIQSYFNMNRAFYGQRESLQQNSKKRMQRYLNRDSRNVKRIAQFLGS